MLVTKEYIQKYGQFHHQIPGLDCFIYRADDFHNKLFNELTQNEINQQIYVHIPEQLFSLSDNNINTPLSSWLINNRQDILDNNRAIFGKILLARSELYPHKKAIYYCPLKAISKAIINLQTYINYAEYPEDGFFKAQHLTQEQLILIQQTREGLLPPIELYAQLQKLKNQSLKYLDFWNIPANNNNLQNLSHEMEIAIDASIN